MSGGSEFSYMKDRLHMELEKMKTLVQSAETIAKIHAIQQAIAKLEEDY